MIIRSRSIICRRISVLDKQCFIRLFRYVLSLNSRRASSRSSMFGKVLDHYTFLNSCSVISGFCFEGVYLWPFVAKMNVRFRTIMVYLSWGTPNSATSTSLLSQLIIRSWMNRKCRGFLGVNKAAFSFKRHSPYKDTL